MLHRILRGQLLEPLPTNFALPKKNVDLNELKQVDLFPSAIFSRCEELSISIPDDSNSGEASVMQAVGAKQLQVQASTLDVISADLDLKPDFIKIDVEGCEFDVLSGARETIRRWSPRDAN